jgi:hypothetical protein
MLGFVVFGYALYSLSSPDTLGRELQLRANGGLRWGSTRQHVQGGLGLALL